MAKQLHIVSFNVPFPANYGGVIDVFYKIKALHQEGIKIILHCFLYDRSSQTELEKYCEKVYYYQRKHGIRDFFSSNPYIIQTRKSKNLLQNLAQDNFPVLFEGLHCCGWLNHPLLKSKKKIIRLHNVEHLYYQQLAKKETNIFKRFYFLSEAKKLKSFEHKLKNAQLLLVLSKYDEHYYSRMYPNVKLITPFHQYQEVSLPEKTEDYILFNADFNINFNYSFAKELAQKAKLANKKLILAGKVDFKLDADLTIIQNPTDEVLEQLIANAFVHIISIEQPTGFKLKLIHALHRSKNIIAVGVRIEELAMIKCNQLNHVSTLDDFFLFFKKIEKDNAPHQQIVNNRNIAFAYFNNHLQALKLISEL